MKKIVCILMLGFLFNASTKAQDSLSIKKTELIQSDTNGMFPFYTDVPFFHQKIAQLKVEYANNSSDTIFGVNLELKLTVKDSLDSIRIPFLDTLQFNDTTLPGRSNTIFLDSTFGYLCSGNYTYSIILKDLNHFWMDSNYIFFSVSDTTISKDFSNFTSTTGPTHYFDTSNNIRGGDTTGDRFGTLFYLDTISYSSALKVSDSVAYRPTTISLHVSNNQNNVGVSIVPHIWQVQIDSLNNSFIVGNSVASSFIPYRISSNHLGRWNSFEFNGGFPLFTSLDRGKYYLVGWETTSRLSANNALEVGVDTSALRLQPSNTSFVYFGHAPNQGWTAINDLPAIRMNFGNVSFITRCSYIVSKAENKIEELSDPLLYPNPVTNHFYLEVESEKAVAFQLFNSLGQQFPINYAPTAEGYRFDAAHLPKGIYFLQTSFSDGQISTQKFIKAE